MICPLPRKVPDSARVPKCYTVSACGADDSLSRKQSKNDSFLWFSWQRLQVLVSGCDIAQSWRDITCPATPPSPLDMRCRLHRSLPI
jgi:hypothetical protein